MAVSAMIREATVEDIEAWVGLRMKLWPGNERSEFESEARAMLGSEREACFVWEREEDKVLAGFVEVSTRDYAEGCSSSPVGYVEGLYVAEGWRRRGIGKKLVERGYAWMAGRGCTEVASDALLENEESIAFHKRIGFVEVERQVVFRRKL